jgi:hypothetical protein
MIEENGPHRNNKSVDLRYLQSDYDTAIINEKVSTYLFKTHVTLYSSAPYKHQQNLAERFVQTIKDGLRTIISYNNTPQKYWCYAAVYYCFIYNHMPRYDKNISRLEDFTGVKPDISQFVPFYAKGVCHVTKEQRELMGGLTFTPKAISCRMLGYGETSNPSMHNTYIVLINNAAYYRHD